MARRVRLSGKGAQKLASSGIKLKAVRRKRVKLVENEVEAQAPRLGETPSRSYEKRPLIDVTPGRPAAEVNRDEVVAEPVRPARPVRNIRPQAEKRNEAMGLRSTAQTDPGVPVRPNQPKRVTITKPKLKWT